MMPVPLSDIDAVVIGASAGGVQALTMLLTPLPPGFTAAVLIVIHLSPDSPSALASLLGARCRLPVTEALDKQPIVPGTIAIAPPNYHLLIEPERTLALSTDAPVHFSRPAIDLLFDSASIAYGPRVLAVLLTGGNEDGSAGLAAIRRRGGKAWVQDPETAFASTMPAAGLAFAGADEILTIDQMSQRLATSHSPPEPVEYRHE